MIASIVAVDKVFGFSKDGKIPWHCPEDFKYFKDTTRNSICIMGKNTLLDMIPYFKGEFLPGRKSIVISSTLTKDDVPANVDIFTNIFDAIVYIKIHHSETNIFFIGGRKIYNDAFDYIDTVYLNEINGEYQCDIFFPTHQMMDFRKESEQVLSDNVKAMIYKRVKNETN